jgi:VWFA-related protein
MRLARHASPRSHAATLAAAAFLGTLSAFGLAATQPAPLQPESDGTRVEVVALGKDGHPVDTLRPQDVTVTIDGAPRQILFVTRISRGPGATADAARRLHAAGHVGWFAAEPVRRVLVIVDQASIIRGDENTVVQASRAFLDRLGIGDRAGVVLLPLGGDRQIELTLERSAAREALGLVRGLRPAPGLAPGDPLPSSAGLAATSDANRVSESQPSSREPAPSRMAAGAGLAGVPRTMGSLAAVTDVLRSLQPIPGRKAVVLFSRGFGSASAAAVTEASVAAVASAATVYAFQLAAPDSDSLSRRADAAALETLATSTGGSFAVLDKKPERVFERAMDALSSVHVLALTPEPGDLDGTRRAVRVESVRKDLTLRAPAWLLPSPERGDEQPVIETPPPAPAERSGGARRPGRPDEAQPVERDSSPELAMALDRVFEYVHAYESRYSALVAEEDYRQIAGQQSVRLRSDFLLVNQESSEGWVCFRDVFEVNGTPVRDRADRLKQLFLEPSPDAHAQLVRIKDESARYNIGSIDRNINLPLFLLEFLRAENRTRSRFKIAGRPEASGIRTWRLEFTERARPTIITDLQDREVPASGSFLVEQSTGAVMETVLRVGSRTYSSEIIVRFALNPDLGMWVPSEMRETYRTTRMPASRPESAMLKGTATYSNFRRFQVLTDAVISIKK